VADPGDRHEERDAAAEAAKAKASKQVNIGCAIFAAPFVALVALLDGYAIYDGLNTNNDDGDSGGDRATALTSCKRAITAQLANPATTDLETLATTISEDASGYTISGPMKAQTGFGVEQALRYRCSTTPAGSILSASVG
jgi:hypothetical protein